MKAVVIALLAGAGLFVLDRLALWAERRGWIYYRKRRASPGTAASALLEVQSLMQPGAGHVIESRTKEEAEEDDSGDPPDTGVSAIGKPVETIETERLLLRRPDANDAESIFTRYASDPEVTRYVGFPRHASIGDTRAFLDYSAREWERWPAGPYLILARETGELLGGTGYTFETPDRALTGYVLARDAWGRGYATEALRAVVKAAPRFGVKELRALCHTGHRPSWHVLEKCGFRREQIVRAYDFPNLPPPSRADVFTYTLTIVP